ncbi:MAG TPA: DNA polymerase III subunit delta [Hellea balneolensis]|uniref:DNA-directed DNA polymerase n=1 Tax=Hellea balneolensis TaxID=287478 RepID=A0A7C3C1N4_9PROT|nr:DNA polymerase III subunit delta [Hellea balneolensis]
MKLSGGRIDAFVKAPPPDMCGVLLFGPDQGLSSERTETLLKRLSDNPDDPFSTTSLSADDLIADPARLGDEMSALSLLGDKRIIRVRLSHERPGAAIAKLVKSLDAEPHRCAAILVIEAGDLSPRSAVRKSFETAKNFTALPSYADTATTLSGLVKSALSAQNIRIEAEALEAFVPLLHGDRRLARTEIEKLILYMGPTATEESQTENPATHILVTLADIKAIASGAGASGLDDIVMHTMSGNMVQCDASYQRALEGKTSPHSVLAALQRHLSRLHHARSLMQVGHSADEAMKNLRPPVFIMQKSAFSQQLRLWGEPALSRALSRALETETQMKTTGAPAEALMGRLLLALSGYAQNRAQRR